MERRINRVTAAVWHFSSGAVGSLTHSLVLHTSHYQTGVVYNIEFTVTNCCMIAVSQYLTVCTMIQSHRV